MDDPQMDARTAIRKLGLSVAPTSDVESKAPPQACWSNRAEMGQAIAANGGKDSKWATVRGRTQQIMAGAALNRGGDPGVQPGPAGLPTDVCVTISACPIASWKPEGSGTTMAEGPCWAMSATAIHLSPVDRPR